MYILDNKFSIIFNVVIVNYSNLWGIFCILLDSCFKLDRILSCGDKRV